MVNRNCTTIKHSRCLPNGSTKSTFSTLQYIFKQIVKNEMLPNSINYSTILQYIFNVSSTSISPNLQKQINYCPNYVI